MMELAYMQDLKSCDPQGSYRFEAGCPDYCKKNLDFLQKK